ncbi:hypothetical protein E2C01_100056 [Portunus trituberculatus]|uniref:Uncharacterized protein n=1 Tax=Portunus trituberculatus TaxID=210409 RepID=A0A5B7K1Z5_PORTR|nr:hypothetical protein [Portunus trituberculatus]
MVMIITPSQQSQIGACRASYEHPTPSLCGPRRRKHVRRPYLAPLPPPLPGAAGRGVGCPAWSHTLLSGTDQPVLFGEFLLNPLHNAAPPIKLSLQRFSGKCQQIRPQFPAIIPLSPNKLQCIIFR